MSIKTERDGLDTTLRADGQQHEYLALPEAERAKGYVRPVRSTYRHVKCNGTTTMARALAETYARRPNFYTGTFCVHCGTHFPVGPEGEFTWVETDGRFSTERVGMCGHEDCWANPKLAQACFARREP